ncbi:hypothetical protein [Spirosoma sp. KUDC1026]|uniref:hypothetical protein n=1 Tax=Spirosoma sp. KUDC1026 TaxID=2745947 RepID=UPI00159BAB03|nr:hypothetical protein [Spirosoma sp. KUDC1026]QKZ15891.1 hypothetical protein HU175_24545 [Spirosoma sp. KUDC1026]
MAQAVRNKTTERNVPDLFAYLCPSCQRWHLTKQSQDDGGYMTVPDRFRAKFRDKTVKY